MNGRYRSWAVFLISFKTENTNGQLYKLLLSSENNGGAMLTSNKGRLASQPAWRERELNQILVNFLFVQQMYGGALPSGLSWAVLQYGSKAKTSSRQQKLKKKGYLEAEVKWKESGHRWFVTDKGQARAEESGLEPTISEHEAARLIQKNPIKLRGKRN